MRRKRYRGMYTQLSLKKICGKCKFDDSETKDVKSTPHPSNKNPGCHRNCKRKFKIFSCRWTNKRRYFQTRRDNSILAYQRECTRLEIMHEKRNLVMNSLQELGVRNLHKVQYSDIISQNNLTIQRGITKIFKEDRDRNKPFRNIQTQDRYQYVNSQIQVLFNAK